VQTAARHPSRRAGQGGYVEDPYRLCVWRRSGCRRPGREHEPARRKCHRRDFHRHRLAGQRIELLRNILPEVSDVALLVNPEGTLAEHQINDAKMAAGKLGPACAVRIPRPVSNSKLAVSGAFFG